ncbi:MAG: TonB-dependent receptor [Cyclobacteriaceae bacterium]
MTKFYLYLRRYLTVLFLLGAFLAQAQNRTVNGKVTSADDGTALPGVNVVQKGTNNGTATDAEGRFTISVPENAVLVFSFVGLAGQEVNVGSQTTIDVSMTPDVTSLSEVVVIGYGSVEKKDLTGSIVTVNSGNFNKGVMSSPQDLILGKVAGVQVVQGSGAPGSGAQIRIRGGSSLNATNDPLIIVDGFPLDNNGPAGMANQLTTINPNDIETFTVLKDASATAIYGSRASNGVIIITTKKGQNGKPEIAYNLQTSLSKPVRFVDVLEGEEYRDIVAGFQGTMGINTDAMNRLGAADTDWQDEIFRSAWSQDHNLSVSGTTKNVPYRVSYGYTDQQGILKTTEMTRHSVNLNVSPTFLNENLKVNASLKGSFSKHNFGDEGAIGSAIGFDPTQSIRNGNTRYDGYYTWTQLPNIVLGDGSQGMNINGSPNTLATRNPVALLNQTNNQSDVKRFIGNIQFDYKFPFLPELRANLNMGFDKSTSDGYNNASKFLGYTNNEGRLTDYTGENLSKLFDLYLNYVKEFGSHKVDATAGYSYQSFERDGSNFSRNVDETVFSDYELDYSDEGDIDGDTVARQNIPNPNYLISFFGRANYTYNNKYLATVTLRADGSSRFADHWGMFPAVSLAWRLSQESFMSSVSAISDLKLRVGYGVTGQQDIGGTYPYLAQFTESTPTAQYQFGNTFYNTYRPGAYDANIKWEETTTFNVGVDFGLFDGKLSGSLEVYSRETKDLLGFIPIASGSNFSNYLTTNVGTLENRGVELTLNAQPIRSANVTWNIGFNLAHNKNEITKLTKVPDPDNTTIVNVGGISGGVGNTVQVHKVGSPANSFYVFQQVYDANGKPLEGLYVDRSGQGGSVSANNLNKYLYHSPAPDILFGINSSVRYKDFDFSFSGRLSVGNYVYNNGASNSTYNGLYVASGFFSNLRESVKDNDFVAPQYWSDYFVENASFFKMDNMSLGYNFNQLLDQKLKARVSFTVQNAFTVTDYSGIDPEVAGGIDNNIYPRPRVFLFGLNLTY